MQDSFLVAVGQVVTGKLGGGEIAVSLEEWN